MIGTHLLEQLNKMRQSGCLCDLELISHDKVSFKVHHAVFVALNPKQFETYMTGKPVDTSSMAVRRIILNSVTSKELKMVVEFLYGDPVVHKSSFDLLEKSLKKLSMGHLIKETGGFTIEPEEVNVKMEPKQLQEHHSPPEITDTSQANVPLFTVETSEGTVHVKLENTYDDETDQKCTEKLVTENNVDVNKANLEQRSEMDTFIENEIDSIFEKTDQMTDVVDALRTVKEKIFNYNQNSNQTQSKKTSSYTACEPIDKYLVSGKKERVGNMLSSNRQAKEIASTGKRCVSILSEGYKGTKVSDHGVDIRVFTSNLGDAGHVQTSLSNLSDRKTEIGEREKLTVQKRKRALNKIYDRQIKSKQNAIAVQPVKTHNAPSINQQQLSFPKDTVTVVPIAALPLPPSMVFPCSVHNQGHIPKNFNVQDILANNQKNPESRIELQRQMEEHLQTHRKTASNKNKYIQVNNKWYLVQLEEETKVTHKNERHHSNTHQHDHISSKVVSKRQKAESCPAESTVNGKIETQKEFYPLNENGNARILRKQKESEDHSAPWTERIMSTRVSSYDKGTEKEESNMSKKEKIQGTTCKYDGSLKSWVISKYKDHTVSCNEQSFLSNLCNDKKAQNNTTLIYDDNSYTKRKIEAKENGNTCCFAETFVVSAYDTQAEKHIVSKEKGNIQNQNEEIPGIHEKCNEDRNEKHDKHHKNRKNTPVKFKEERNETSEKSNEERNETSEKNNEERKERPENSNEEIYCVPEIYNEDNNERSEEYNKEGNKTFEKFYVARHKINENRYKEDQNKIPKKDYVEINETHQKYNVKRNEIPKKLNEDTNETQEKCIKEIRFIFKSNGNGAQNDSAKDREKTKSCNEKCTSKSKYENNTKTRDHMQVNNYDVEKNLSESHNDKNKESFVGVKKEESCLFHNEARCFSSETNNDKDAKVNEILKYEEDDGSYKEKTSFCITQGTYKADIKTETKDVECINSQNVITTSLSQQGNVQLGEIQAILENTKQCFNENTKPIFEYSACNDNAKSEVQQDKENTFSCNEENILTCEQTTCNDKHSTVLKDSETILTREEQMSASKETEAQNIDNDIKIHSKEERCLISVPIIDLQSSDNFVNSNDKNQNDSCKAELSSVILAENMKKPCIAEESCISASKIHQIGENDTRPKDKESINIFIKEENFIPDPCICKGSEDDAFPVSKENINSCIDTKCLISEPAIIDKTSRNDILLKEEDKIQQHKKENISMLKEVGNQDLHNDTSFKSKEIPYSCTEVSSCLRKRKGRTEPGYIHGKKHKNKSKLASNKLKARDSKIASNETVSDIYEMKKVSVQSKSKTSRTDFELLPLSLTSCIPSSEILTLCLLSKEQTKNTLNCIDGLNLKGLKPDSMSKTTNTNYKEPPVSSDILKMYSPSTKCPLLLNSLNSKRQSFSNENQSKCDKEKYSGSCLIPTPNKAFEKTSINSKNIKSDRKKCSPQPGNIEDTILESTVDKQVRKNNCFEQSPSPRVKNGVSGTISEMRSADYFLSMDESGNVKSRLPEALLDANLLSTKSEVINLNDEVRFSFDMLGNKSTRIKKVHLDFSSSKSKLCPSWKIDHSNMGNVGCSYQINQARNTERSELEDEPTDFSKIKIHETAIQEDGNRQSIVSKQPVIQNKNTGNKYPSHNFETLKRMIAQPSPASCKSSLRYSPQSNVALLKANDNSSGTLLSENSVYKRNLDKDKKLNKKSGEKKHPQRLKATKEKNKLKEKKYIPETLKFLSEKVVNDNLCNNYEVIKRLMGQRCPSIQLTELKPGANRTSVKTNERPLALIAPRQTMTRIPVVLCQGNSPNITISPVTSRRPMLLSNVNERSPDPLPKDNIIRKRCKDKGNKRKKKTGQMEIPKRLKVTKEKSKLIEKHFFPEKLKYLTEKVVNDNLCNNKDVINRLMSKQCPSDQVNEINNFLNKNVVQTNERFLAMNLMSSSPTITRIPVVVCKGNSPNITISPVSTRRPLKLIAPKPENQIDNGRNDPITQTDLTTTSDVTDLTSNARKRHKSFESKIDEGEVRHLKKSKSSAQILLKYSLNTSDEGTNKSEVINRKINSSEVYLQSHSELETSHGKVTSDEESIPLSMLALKLASKPYQDSSK